VVVRAISEISAQFAPSVTPSVEIQTNTVETGGCVLSWMRLGPGCRRVGALSSAVSSSVLGVSIAALRI
jgi:hypothetical protein